MQTSQHRPCLAQDPIISQIEIPAFVPGMMPSCNRNDRPQRNKFKSFNGSCEAVWASEFYHSCAQMGMRLALKSQLQAAHGTLQLGSNVIYVSRSSSRCASHTTGAGTKMASPQLKVHPAKTWLLTKPVHQCPKADLRCKY